MNIYGKSLRDIFFDMPIPYKIVVIVGVCFLFFVFLYFATMVVRIAVDEKVPSPVGFLGRAEGTSVFDPSAAYDPQKQQVWMTYTSLNKGQLVTQLAYSPISRACRTAETVKPVFTSRPDDELIAPDGLSTLARGTWRYETASIVYDPQDPDRAWKIFSYKYFWATSEAAPMPLVRRYGAIVLKTAKDPLGEWSNEEWILSPAPDFPPMPYQQLVKSHINMLHPDLSGVSFYGRPSVVIDGKYLLMSLSAFADAGEKYPDRIILLLSPDHGKSWVYLGTALVQEDLVKMGDYTHIAGASLIKQGQDVLLAAVLGDKLSQGTGTFILSFEKKSEAKLVRDGAGAPVVRKYIPRSSVEPTFYGGGFASYVPECQSGILTGEHSGLTGKFEIFRTFQEP